MAPERRNEIILGVLALVLAGTAYRAWQSTAVPPPPASETSRPADRRGAAPAPGSAAERLDVHLDALNAERPKPEANGRDLFRFKPKAPPPPPPSATRPAAIAPPAPTGPPPAPSVPPITLKFIGTMEQPNGKPKLGVFSDGVGPPMVGPEGGVLDGRYRILKIGAESAEIAYLDGRGRTTLRLSGG
jgi:hypothetical protein